MPTAKPRKSASRAPRKSSKPSKAAAVNAKMTLADAMAALEKAGSPQARKTYARHGASGPMFGVPFSALKVLLKRIGVDHGLAQELWSTGNLDARMLSVKVADPAGMTQSELGRWAREAGMPMLVNYVAQLAAEGPHAVELAEKWAASPREAEATAAWGITGQLALRDEELADRWFDDRLAEIERGIHSAPNGPRACMNQTLIQIGCRSPRFRKLVAAAARRIGTVEVDHGDTDCKTPDAGEYIEKCWQHSTSKGFASPAAHERSRECMRTRC